MLVAKTLGASGGREFVSVRRGAVPRELPPTTAVPLARRRLIGVRSYNGLRIGLLA